MQSDFDDHWHEECGVFGIYGDPEAAEKTYLGLYALQHRGQESAGIASTDGNTIALKKGLGLVWSVFADPTAMPRLKGSAAIGHNRYSTRGASDIINAQPICIESRLGMMALAHNGTISNASELRLSLQARGAIFQTTSDSEIMLHLMAHSQQHSFMDILRDALAQLQGAFSLVLLTPGRLIAARDPHGFRPLSLGRAGTGN
jgi:amidophosphoribosyltransferase